MTSVPYPTFLTQTPVDPDGNRAALSAVGKCRICPDSCYESSKQSYLDIVKKAIEQGAAVVADNASDEEKSASKTLKKKLMKQGVAMAKTYLMESLQLDVSIVDVEIVVSPKDLLESDGCLASCFLDAGCHAVVTDGTNLEALDSAKVPRDRLIGHFLYASSTDVSKLAEMITAASKLVSVVSIETDGADADLLDKLMKLAGEPTQENAVQIVVQVAPTNVTVATSDENGSEEAAWAAMIANVSKRCRGLVTLVDPTPKQLGTCYAAFIKTDRPDGLYTTVVCTRSNEALGLVYSSKESVIASLECGRAVYYSRSRKGLWRKGDTSGHFQTLHRLDLDCDGDALRFTVTQRGDDVAAFCHLNTLTCWGKPKGLRELEETLANRLKSAPEGSYTKRLFDDPELLRDKLVEEAQELSEATEKQHVAEELADVLYFAMVRAAKAGVSIDDAAAEIDRRARKVTRRKGDSKAFRIAAGDAILKKT